jgi:hypothetical protein
VPVSDEAAADTLAAAWAAGFGEFTVRLPDELWDELNRVSQPDDPSALPEPDHCEAFPGTG